MASAWASSGCSPSGRRGNAHSAPDTFECGVPSSIVAQMRAGAQHGVETRAVLAAPVEVAPQRGGVVLPGHAGERLSHGRPREHDARVVQDREMCREVGVFPGAGRAAALAVVEVEPGGVAPPADVTLAQERQLERIPPRPGPALRRRDVRQARGERAPLRRGRGAACHGEHVDIAPLRLKAAERERPVQVDADQRAPAALAHGGDESFELRVHVRGHVDRSDGHAARRLSQ